jgi:hypothetical protein
MGRFFQGRGYRRSYYDDEYYMRRRSSKRGRKSSRRYVPPPPADSDNDDMSVLSDLSMDDESRIDLIPEDSKSETYMTPIQNPSKQNKDIRGSELLQKPDVPWESNSRTNSNEPEVIQRKIMEEISQTKYADSNQLSSMPI